MPERLSDARVQTFLATKEVVVLGTTEPDGGPLLTPMWFVHDPGTLTMVSIAGSRKIRNLVRDARVMVVAEAGTRGDARGVAVRGRAELVPDGEPHQRLVDALLDKYDPDLMHKWGGRALPASRALVRIHPTAVRSWGL